MEGKQAEYVARQRRRKPKPATGPHRGTVRPDASTKPAFSTQRGPAADKKLAATRAHAEELHRRAHPKHDPFLGTVAHALARGAHAVGEVEAGRNRHMHAQLEGHNKPKRGWGGLLADTGRAIGHGVQHALAVGSPGHVEGHKPQTREDVADRLEKSGFHKEARQVRAGLPISKGLGERLGSDVQDMAKGFVPGVYNVGKALTLDTADLALHPARPQYRRTGHLGKEIALQYAHNYRHPLRYASEHPGFFGLDAAAFASAGAGAATRVSAAGRALGETGSVRAALARPSAEGGSLLKRPLPEERTHLYQGQPIRGRFSTNPAVKAIQKRNDAAALRRGKPLFSARTERPSTISSHKAARLLDEERRVVDAAERAPIIKVGIHAKHADTGQNLAVDVVGVGLPVEEHVALLRSAAAKAKGKTRQRLARRAKLIEEKAAPYIDESSGKPRIAEEYPGLVQAVKDARNAIGKTEEDLHSAELLSRGGAEARRHAAGRVLLGAKFEAKSLAEGNQRPDLMIGKRVRTAEGLRGAIVELTGDTAHVRLWRKGNAVIQVPLEELYPASGKTRTGRLVGGGRAITRTREATIEEAKADLEALNARIDKLTKPIIEREYQTNKDSYEFMAESRRLKPASGREAQEIIRRPHGQGIDIQRTGETAIPVERDFKGQKPRATPREIAAEQFWKSVYGSKHESALRLQQMVKEAGQLKDAIEAHEAPGWMQTRSPLTEVYTQRFGNVVDVDDVRELIPAYAKGTQDERAALAGETHASAKAGADRIYDELLAEQPRTGKVALMGGGSGAGKSTARVRSQNYDVVLDTTLADEAKSIAKVERALKSGRSVDVTYVYRDPAEAYVNGVLNPERLEAHGRVVPLAEHVRMHVQSNKTIRDIAKKYEGDKRVSVAVVDNSKPGAPEIPVSKLPALKYDQVEKEVRSAYEAEAPRLSEAQREAALRPGRGRAEAPARGGAEARPGSADRGGGASQEDLGVPLLGTREEFASSVPYTGGEFYTPETVGAKKPRGPMAFRGGIPRKPSSLTNPYTGALRSTGRNTEKVLQAITENLLSKQRYLSVVRLRDRIVPMGVKARPADTVMQKWAPVLERSLTNQERAALRDAVENVQQLTPDAASRIDAALQQVRDTLFPERQYGTVAPGTEIPGIVWVDRRLIGAQHKLIGSLGPIDVVQDAVKGLILYAKPGYVAPNVLGNVGYNLIQQGFLAPANYARAARMSEEAKFLIDDVMGSGISRSIAEGTSSPITKAVHGAGNFWSRFVDDLFRRSAWVHEAQRYGFRDEAAWRDLIENPANRERFAEVTQRARDAIVDYERMGPAERDVIRRLIFVYPWVKGSTYYAAQFLRDHPVQAAVFAALAQNANEHNLRDIGPVPAWAAGSFKVFEKNGHPYVVNPQSISPFSTPAQVIAAAQGGFGSVERSQLLGEMVSPVVQSAIEAGFQRDLFTGEELKGGYVKDFGSQIGKGLPGYQLYKREAHPNEEATYPYGPVSAAGQFILGGASPRPINQGKLNAQSQSRNPIDRIKARIGNEQQAVFAGLRGNAPKTLKGTQLHQRLTTAYDRKEAVDTMRERVKLDVGTGEPYDRAVLLGELKLLRSWGLVGDNAAKRIRQAAATGSWDDVKEWRNVLRSDGFEEEYLGLIREAKQEAGVK